MKSSGTELSPTPRQQMYLQRLYLYMNMTKPTDILYLSFARTKPEGSTLHPSYLIQMIRKLFPDAAVEHPQLRPAAEQLTGAGDGIVWISGALREYAQGKWEPGSEESDSVMTAYGFMMREGGQETVAALEKLKDAAFTRYDPVWISRETARSLYGTTVFGGISRMETAARCPLMQFLQYGLGLKKREEFVIEPVDTGRILHQSLERFSKNLQKKGLSWRDFTPEEGQALAREALQDTAASYNDLLMYSTKRSEAQLARMEQILIRTADTLQYQLQKGKFEPEGFEYSFGPGGEADMITFPLSEGRWLKLVGRIDRLDLCRQDDSVFVKILDYKSGSNDLKEDLMRRGLQLQLIMYMNAVLKDLAAANPGKEILPAAMLYYKITDAVLDGGSAVSDGSSQEEPAAESPSEETMAGIRAALRPTGMVNDDPASYTLLDTSIAGKSDVIPLIAKNGKVTARGSHVFTTAGFEALSKEVNEVVCKLAEEILDGNASAEPAVWDKDKEACTYCPYKEVCGFDLSVDGYRYRDH